MPVVLPCRQGHEAMYRGRQPNRTIATCDEPQAVRGELADDDMSHATRLRDPRRRASIARAPYRSTASATPASAPSRTTASGGIFQRASRKNPIAATAKSIEAFTALVHTGE